MKKYATKQKKEKNQVCEKAIHRRNIIASQYLNR